MCQCSQLVLTGDFPRQKLQLPAIDIAGFYETRSKKTKVISHFDTPAETTIVEFGKALLCQTLPRVACCF